MRQKRLETDDENEIIIDGESDDITDLQADIDSQLDNIFNEFGGDDRDTRFKIKIYRIMPDKGDREYCFSCVPSELPILDRVGGDYGGGRYEAWTLKNGKIFKRQGFNVAPPPKRPVNPAAGFENVMATLAENQNKQFEKLAQLMVAHQQNQAVPVAPPPQQFNPMEMMQGMAGMLASLHSMTSKSESNMDMFFKALDVAKDLTADREGKTTWDGVTALAKEFGPPLVQLVAAGNEIKNQSVSENRGVLPPSKPGNPTPPLTTHEAQPPLNPSKTMTPRQILDFLCEKAKANTDPGLYVDFLMDNQQFLTNEVVAIIMDPNALQFITQLNPNVAHYKPWFNSFISMMSEAISIPNPESELTNNENTDDNIANEISPERIDASGSQNDVTGDT